MRSTSWMNTYCFINYQKKSSPLVRTAQNTFWCIGFGNCSVNVLSGFITVTSYTTITSHLCRMWTNLLTSLLALFYTYIYIYIYVEIGCWWLNYYWHHTCIVSLLNSIAYSLILCWFDLWWLPIWWPMCRWRGLLGKPNNTLSTMVLILLKALCYVDHLHVHVSRRLWWLKLSFFVHSLSWRMLQRPPPPLIGWVWERTG